MTSFRRRGARSACAFALVALAASSLAMRHADAAINWDGEAGTNWWFDPVNWGTHSVGAVGPFRVPPTSDGNVVTDANINNGWNFGGDGVVFDTSNDPFFASLTPADYDLPDAEPAFDRDTIWRLYLTTSSATTSNKFTLKSGTLEAINNASGATGNIQIGRGGATAGLKGVFVQTGGSFLVRDDNIDVGNFNTSAGNGEYHYYGGTLEAGLNTASTKGIRLAAGSGSGGSAATSYFGVHNTGPAGRIRAHQFVVGANLSSGGTTNSVSTVEFFANNQGTRPIQVAANLSINHQDDSAGVTGSKRSAVLKLALDAAPALLAGVPLNMGLFDIGGILTGQSARFYTDTIDNGGTIIDEGATLSATFGGSTYNWTISYTGNISYSDIDNSVVSSITGAGTGTDIVLIGLSSVVGGTPGDFNGDTKVDGADFLAWQRGQSPSPLSAGDLNAWKTGYGAGAASAVVAAVPEPTSVVIALVGMGALALRRRLRQPGVVAKS